MDASVCGSPPALCVSAYLRRPITSKGSGKSEWTVIDSHHASAPLAGIGERLPQLQLALQLCHELRDKLQTHASMPHAADAVAPDAEARTTRGAAVAAALVDAASQV